MAMLFALDRAGAVDEIAALRREHDVVIMDRYVASNAAYTAARLHQDAAGPAVQWIHALEYQRLGLPAPDWQVLLAVPAELAGRATATNVTTGFSNAPARSTPNWPPRAGVAAG
jgi:dTMP kinase